MHLRMVAKQPGTHMRLAPVTLEFHHRDFFGAQPLPDAYERLLLDALHGDTTLFLRSDEIEQSWRVIEPLLSPRAPAIYEPGTDGPDEARQLLADGGGRAWAEGCGAAARGS